MSHESSVGEILDALASRIDGPTSQQPTMDDESFAHLRFLLNDASGHAHVGSEVPATARARALQQLLVDALRPITSYQRVYNNRVLEVLTQIIELVQSQALATPSIETRLDRMNATVATLDVAIDEVAEQLRTIDESGDDSGARSAIVARLDALEARIDALRDDAGTLEEPDAETAADSRGR